MKKIVITAVITFCACVGVLAQSRDSIEFMGLSLCDNDTTAFCSLLKDKGYTFLGEKDGTIMYKGVFANLAAEAMVVPFGGSDKVNAVIIFLNDLNPMKMGALYAELMQKFMAKYQDYKYDTVVDNNGNTTTSFRNDVGFVALQSSVSGIGKCKISIYYSCSKSATDNSTNKGIGVDDL